MTTPRQPAAGPSAIPLQDPKEVLGPPSAGSRIGERYFRAGDKCDRCQKRIAAACLPCDFGGCEQHMEEHDRTCPEETDASDKPPAGPSASLSEALTGKEGLGAAAQAERLRAGSPCRCGALSLSAGVAGLQGLDGTIHAPEMCTATGVEWDASGKPILPPGVERASEQPRAAPVKDPSASLPAGPKDLERAAIAEAVRLLLAGGCLRPAAFREEGEEECRARKPHKKWCSACRALEVLLDARAPSASAVPATQMGAAAPRSPRVGVALLVTDSNGRVLFGQRGKEPNRGLWVLPGGGVRFGEHWQETGERELREETGLLVEVDESVAPIFVEVLGDDEHRIILTARARVIGGVQQAASDLLDVGFFGARDWPPLSPVAGEMLAKFGFFSEQPTAGPSALPVNPAADERIEQLRASQPPETTRAAVPALPSGARQHAISLIWEAMLPGNGDRAQRYLEEAIRSLEGTTPADSRAASAASPIGEDEVVSILRGRLHEMAKALDAHHRGCPAIDLARQYDDARREAAAAYARGLEEGKFNPLGDNHHNAAACPYCGDPLGKATARVKELEAALRDCVEIVDKAGLLNLSNGVQLGATSWYVKAFDAFDYARRLLGSVATAPTAPLSPSGALAGAEELTPGDTQNTQRAATPGTSNPEER